MHKVKTLDPWLVRAGEAAGQTVGTIQWSVLLLVVFLGLMSNSDAVVLMILLGMLTALGLFGLCLSVLNFDMDRPWKFLFSAKAPSLLNCALSVVIFCIGLGVAYLAVISGDIAAWLLGRIPAWLAPKPDESLTVVFLACAAYTAIAGIVFLKRRRNFQQLGDVPLAQMGRKARRAEKISAEVYAQYNAVLQAARDKQDYWSEAALTLGLASVALVPGALGWSWLWGVGLSIVLPMFVLSVRFRMKSPAGQPV